MAELIIKTRIMPKKLIDSIISRERLINLIDENIDKSIILVTSPAGFGKTTLVLDFMKKSGRKFAWFYLAPDINNFPAFAAYLVHSLKELNNDFGGITLELLSSMIESGVLASDEKNSINALIGTFANEFVNNFSEDVYLVMDDLHNAGTGSWITHTFNSLIEDFPPNLHIFITSRTLPEFNYPRLSAKRNLLKIDSKDLNFNLDETGKLLKEIYSIDCGLSELQLLDNKIEGWITGLHLILQAYGKNFRTIFDKKSEIEENIFLYFAEEIFKSLDNETREFLITTSIVDSFTEGLCNELPGITNAGKIISNLRNKNIFLESSQIESGETGQETAYSYHNLFKLFLNAKLNELKTSAEIEVTASYIFNYFSKTGDEINAIEFALLSKKCEQASGLIISAFDALFTAGKYELLERWISNVPDEVINKTLKLKYYSGILQKQYKVNLDEAANTFRLIISSEKKGSDLYLLAKTELSEIMLEKGKPQEAVESLKELLEICKDISMKIKISISLAKAYYRLGSKYYDDIIDVLNSTIRICEDNNIREYHAEIYSFYGRVNQNRGEFSKSLHYFKNVIELENNVFKKFQALTDIVLCYSWSGDYAKAKEYLDKAELIFRHFHANAFQRSILRITALFKFEAGDFEDSISKFTELNALDLRNNISSYLFLHYMFMSEIYILLNKKEKAKELIELTISSNDTKDEYRELLINYHRAILDNLTKPGPAAEKALLEAHRFFEEQNLVYSKAQAEFHLADYYFKTSKLQTSIKFLKDSLDTSSGKQFNSFLAQNFVNKHYMFDFALVNKIHVSYIGNLSTILMERESYSWLSDECKQRLKNEQLCLFDITLNTFGGFELAVRGIPIGEDKWVRKKTKLLLAYLLIHPELKHTKDKVLNLFFGDLSTTSAENIFHQSITNIRNVVKPYSPSGQPEEKGKKKTKQEKFNVSDSFIQYEDKILRISQGYNYKTDALEFIKIANRIKSPELDEGEKERAAKQSIELYKGEFLPGYYDDWIEDMRMNLQNRFIEVCEFLIELLKKKLKYEEVAFYSEKIIREDKLHEEAFISLIEAYAQTGNINMAKKKFSQMLKNFELEYGEKPPKKVLDRVEKVLISD